ncbi:hypothetical protein ACFRU3_38205 [Streptomyces sp. NPDC056910]|uniref:hypothetical protein n=1 Tax=Streptomyces sp. NPDC056910 TaxID=3345964 RepID=UPI003697DBAC
MAVLTMDAVAARAGVSNPAMYRRRSTGRTWSSLPRSRGPCPTWGTSEPGCGPS